MGNNSKNLTYADAGVNIDAGNQLVDSIKETAKSTFRNEVLTGLGGFAGLFELDKNKYQNPVLVSATDGVGTKLKLANLLNIHNTIGIDLVAMCVNDLIVCGAEPLFFLDYFATGKLQPNLAAAVIAGIGTGCKQAGSALIGGETAEMPGMYQNQDYDLAGFCVGAVEKTEIIDGSKIKPGDSLIALASNGIHSNGFSLIRKIIELKQIDLSTPFANNTLGEELLKPTRIYVKAILSLLNKQEILGMAHITGGGIVENLPRILPNTVKAVIHPWQWPEIFTWLQQQGNIATPEMLKTFNCGVGMLICVPAEQAKEAVAHLTTCGETAWIAGTIESRNNNENQVEIT